MMPDTVPIMLTLVFWWGRILTEFSGLKLLLWLWKDLNLGRYSETRWLSCFSLSTHCFQPQGLSSHRLKKVRSLKVISNVLTFKHPLWYPSWASCFNKVSTCHWRNGTCSERVSFYFSLCIYETCLGHWRPESRDGWLHPWAARARYIPGTDQMVNRCSLKDIMWPPLMMAVSIWCLQWGHAVDKWLPRLDISVSLQAFVVGQCSPITRILRLDQL